MLCKSKESLYARTCVQGISGDVMYRSSLLAQINLVMDYIKQRYIFLVKIFSIFAFRDNRALLNVVRVFSKRCCG